MQSYVSLANNALHISQKLQEGQNLYVYIRVSNSQPQAAQYHLDKRTRDQCRCPEEKNTMLTPARKAS